MAIDWNFIQRLEGKENTAYIPMQDGEVMGKSGVTIGTGVDLGYQSKEELKELGVSEDILNKLDPYFGKTKDEAVKVLQEEGQVTLSDEEITEMDKAIKSKTLNQIKNWYNKDNKQGQDWGDLSDRQQTVVSSVFFQYGLGGAPGFKKQIEEGDWSGAIENMKSFASDGSYQTRRNKEIQFLVGSTPDGILGPKTESAIDSFLTNQEVMTPDAPTPSPSYSIDPVGFLDNLMILMDQRIQGDAGVAQEASQGVSEARTEQQPERSSDKLKKSISSALSRTIEEGEQQLERTANEAELEAEAKEAPSRRRLSLIDKLSAVEKTKAKRATGTRETEKPVRVNQGTMEEKDDSLDPTYGIF